jgi:murein DD-endopeptidase MepM/ murein hydrolase activator NlpD
MIDERYYVKIVPHRGETVHRFQVRRRHIVAVGLALGVVILGSLIYAGATVLHARALVAQMRREAAAQQAALRAIDRQTDTIRAQLQRVRKQNTEIRALIGAPAPAPAARKTSWTKGRSMHQVAQRVDDLQVAEHTVLRESDAMKRLALHIVNIHHLRSLARAEMLAAIPSINPVPGAPIVGCFCYRTYPDVEFHEGVDLGADYGDAVHAAAAGVVTADGYDGGYGIKIVIDHGNGYHTWYAHLSSVSVYVGQHVYKGEVIGAVGETGFATGPHLHYQVMYKGTPIDPTPFLQGVPANVLASLP